MNLLKLDILWKKNWPLLATTKTKKILVKYFKVKHKVLKNLLHGQTGSEFEKSSLKMSGKT
jgi:hypothetical protein